MTACSPPDELLARSHRLGADPRATNYGGGNTSAKGEGVDPVTGDAVELMWVKGSGGDLATLRPAGVATLRLDRLRALTTAYRGPEHEDEMVGLLDFCGHGRAAATPSIDTAMHGLLEAAHVDHLHPDAGIALATAVDGEQIVRACFGERVVWVPWRRPGFQLGLDVAAVQRDHAAAIGCVLAGHGITAWGATSDECERHSLELIRTAEKYLRDHGRPDPFGDLVPGFEPLPAAQRRSRASRLAPVLRGLVSSNARQVGHFTDDPRVLEFLSGTSHPRLARLGTSCPDHFLRTKIRPLLLDLAPGAPVEHAVARLRELVAEYRIDYARYYHDHADADSPPMRGADPAIVLVPGVGMFSFGKDKHSARIAGEFYLNAINAMRGAQAVSTYQPIDDDEKFRIEYWALEEAKLARLPPPRPLTGRVAVVTSAGAVPGASVAARLATEGACVVLADADAAQLEAAAGRLGGRDVAVAVTGSEHDENRVREIFEAACLAFGGVDLVVNATITPRSAPSLDTTPERWDAEQDVLARGAFLLAREAVRVMAAQGIGGDLVTVTGGSALDCPPDDAARAAAFAERAHQVRLLAAELGKTGVRVNGVVATADAGRTADGTPPDHAGDEHNVAAAVFALAAGDLDGTTGLMLPVVGALSTTFLR